MTERPSPRRGVFLGLAMAACVFSKIPGLLVFAIPGFGAAYLPRRVGIGAGARRCLCRRHGLVDLPRSLLLPALRQVQEQAALTEEDEVRSTVVGANLETVAGWLWAYWTPGVCAVGLVAFTAAVVRRDGAAFSSGLPRSCRSLSSRCCRGPGFRAISSRRRSPVSSWWRSHSAVSRGRCAASLGSAGRGCRP